MKQFYALPNNSIRNTLIQSDSQRNGGRGGGGFNSTSWTIFHRYCPSITSKLTLAASIIYLWLFTFIRFELTVWRRSLPLSVSLSVYSIASSRCILDPIQLQIELKLFVRCSTTQYDFPRALSALGCPGYEALCFFWFGISFENNFIVFSNTPFIFKNWTT